MRYKYVILGNLASIMGFSAIALASYDWRISIALGIGGAVIGNYMFYDINKKINKFIKSIIDKYGKYLGYEYKNNRIINVGFEDKKETDDDYLMKFL